VPGRADSVEELEEGPAEPKNRVVRQDTGHGFALPRPRTSHDCIFHAALNELKSAVTMIPPQFLPVVSLGCAKREKPKSRYGSSSHGIRQDGLEGRSILRTTSLCCFKTNCSAHGLVLSSPAAPAARLFVAASHLSLVDHQPDMKIAVTGASGNLGSRVTRIAISHGHKVVGIDRAKPVVPPPLPEGASEKDEYFRFVEVDVREYDQVIEAFRGCDAVIHLAAIPNPGDYVVSTHNL